MVEIGDQDEKTKAKKAIILKFAQDVTKIVNTKNDNEYITGLMKLNQDYVKSDLAYREKGKKRDADQIEEFYQRLKQMESTILQLRKNKEKTEMRIQTDSKLRTKQNTNLVVWNNNLKFEYKKQCVVFKKKQIEQRTLQDNLNNLKKKETKVRRQYNELINSKANSSRASSAVPKGGDSEVAFERTQSRQGGRAFSANRQAADTKQEEEMDMVKVQQLYSQIERSNLEIQDNARQINMIKQKIY